MVACLFSSLSPFSYGMSVPVVNDPLGSLTTKFCTFTYSTVLPVKSTDPMQRMGNPFVPVSIMSWPVTGFGYTRMPSRPGVALKNYRPNLFNAFLRDWIYFWEQRCQAGPLATINEVRDGCFYEMNTQGKGSGRNCKVINVGIWIKSLDSSLYNRESIPIRKVT